MSAETATTDSYNPNVGRGLAWTLRDSWTEAKRHITPIPRDPELLVYAIVQPIMFILLFNYVFGGSIAAEGYDSYTQFLIPGILAQTVVFGSAYTSVGIAEDMQKGFMDRLRSLPISQPAVLIGRTFSDMLRNLVSVVSMVAVSLAIGFRFNGGIANAALAIGILLLFSYALSWINALIGLSVKSVEAANSAGFTWMFPLTFVSSAFVPTQNMTPWLRRIAEANPFTILTNACRALTNGLPVDDTLWQSLAWSLGIIAIFGFLSIRKFTNTNN
ncbi:MAG: ABC transporter permease [Acidimicrobiia bacterium]|nr:ABC transporter permease [Acidimicrobiia bacterium]